MTTPTAAPYKTYEEAKRAATITLTREQNIAARQQILYTQSNDVLNYLDASEQKNNLALQGFRGMFEDQKGRLKRIAGEKETECGVCREREKEGLVEGGLCWEHWKKEQLKQQQQQQQQQ
jgi:hypothetical protein